MTIATLTATPDPVIRNARSGYQCLTDIQKRAIITAIAAGTSQLQLARQYRVNPSTIWRVKKSFVECTPGTVLEGDWRKKLHNTLPSKAVDALERSIEDREDVHRAAATGVNVLKGLGHLQGDSVTVNVQAMMNAVPAEWRDDLVVSHAPTSSDSLPDNSAVVSIETHDTTEL